VKPALTAGDILGRLRAGTLMPYLGPGVAELAASPVPTTYEDLAAFLGRQVALPRRARGNCWSAAQYIETTRHRVTLERMLQGAFADPVPPTALHRGLAALAPPMIVDTWYDGAMRAALASTPGWGEIQGTTRARLGEHRWYRAYDASGTECDPREASAWRTLLYKPHGGIAPAHDFLITDADYVEVLTEIDIQTPIPDDVQRRRAAGGFLFLGCRFHDQMLRAYARQVTKRSAGPHVALVRAATLTDNERRFLDVLGAELVDLDLAAFATALAAA
jgi:hypothetical protein